MNCAEEIFRELWPNVSLKKGEVMILIRKDAGQFLEHGTTINDAVRAALSIVGVAQYSGAYPKRKVKRITKILVRAYNSLARQR